MTNTFGTIFRISSFGESHGKIIGIIVDGVPAGLDFDMNFIQNELDKRKPAQSRLTSTRSEIDEVKVYSGVFNGKATGAPICLIIENKDIDSSEYEKLKNFLRPSQVDYPALKKYGGFADYRGSGRFSGRITAGFVMAGAIAKQVLKKHNISVFAYTKSIGDIEDDQEYEIDDLERFIGMRENSIIRALNHEKSKQMEALIEEVKRENDSIGGTIKCIVGNVPPGVGGPVFNSLESNLSKAIFSIPAIKGIEFGRGFKAARMRGSEHNDPWISRNGKIEAIKNDSGGIIGGISTGMPIEFTAAMKPTASIGIPQKTINVETLKSSEIQIKGRHDPCIVPRAIVIIEAMTAIVLVDQLLMEGKISSLISNTST